MNQSDIMIPLVLGAGAYLLTNDSCVAAILTAGGTYLYLNYSKSSKPHAIIEEPGVNYKVSLNNPTKIVTMPQVMSYNLWGGKL